MTTTITDAFNEFAHSVETYYTHAVRRLTSKKIIPVEFMDITIGHLVHMAERLGEIHTIVRWQCADAYNTNVVETLKPFPNPSTQMPDTLIDAAGFFEAAAHEFAHRMARIIESLQFFEVPGDLLTTLAQDVQHTFEQTSQLCGALAEYTSAARR